MLHVHMSWGIFHSVFAESLIIADNKAAVFLHKNL